jgi:hypothetical protein
MPPVRIKDVILTVRLDGERTVMIHSRDAGAPSEGLPSPGQKGKLFTFRIMGLPLLDWPEKAAEIIIRGFKGHPDRPGRTWHVAYNIPWERLRKHGLEAAEPGILVTEAAKAAGRGFEGLRRAMVAGKLAVTRPSREKVGGMAPPQVNPVDLAVFLEANPIRQGRRTDLEGKG